MTTPIEKGDIVQLWWANPRSDEPNVTDDVEVLHTSAGPGDLFYFKDGDGEVFAVNANSLSFEGMMLTRRRDDAALAAAPATALDHSNE